MTTCAYLRHQVGEGRVKPLALITNDVVNFKRPKTKKQVRAFLGLSGYYRHFIQGYATTAAPLLDLAKKDEPEKVCWDEHHDKAFDSLKEALVTQPVLQGPRTDRRFYLQTDASNVGIGAILSQKDEEGNDRPVAYYSSKLNKAEKNYSTVERECLAIVKGIEHFNVYLTAVPFTVITDHACLQYLQLMRNWGGRLTRWALKLQPFTFTLQHRAGALNGNADGMSRQAWTEDEEPGVDVDARGGGGGSVMALEPQNQDDRLNSRTMNNEQ